MKIAKKLKPILGVVVALIICFSASISSSAANEAPKLKDSDVDLVPYMEYKTYGKQEDAEDGKRQEISESKDGVTVKFNSQSVDYGIRFNNDYIKPDGTLYYSFRLDPENDLWEGGTNHIYGGPKIQLAKVAFGEDMFTNFLTIQFTQGDGIDFRIADKAGSDVYYLGGLTSGLKVDYPDTGSRNKGSNGYDVIVKLSKIGVSMWVKETKVIDDVHWDSLYGDDGVPYPFEFQEFAPGISTAASRTTVHDFRLWCSAADATVKAESSDKKPSDSGNTSSGNITSSGASSNKNDTGISSNENDTGISSNKNDTDTSSNKNNTNTSSNKNDDNVSSNNTASELQPSDTIISENEDGTEVIIGDSDGGSTLVKAQKVEIPTVLPTAIIIGIAVLGVGAIVVILYYVILKKKL